MKSRPRSYEERLSALCGEAFALSEVAKARGDLAVSVGLQKMVAATLRRLPESSWPVELVGRLDDLDEATTS